MIKIAKIKGYEPLFEKAFGDKIVNKDRVAKAIATFERTNKIHYKINSIDLLMEKKDLFSDDEVMGLHLFRTKAKCINCHNTGYFSNNQFENIGTALLSSKNEDLGRYTTTKKPDDVGKFRVPTLREVGRTGPWMHNRSLHPTN